MSIASRLNQYINYKNISKKEFYVKTGLSYGLLDKGENIGSDKIERIVNEYPEINLRWLIHGFGSRMEDLTFLNSDVRTYSRNRVRELLRKTVDLETQLKPMIEPYFKHLPPDAPIFADTQTELLDNVKVELEKLNLRVYDLDLYTEIVTKMMTPEIIKTGRHTPFFRTNKQRIISELIAPPIDFSELENDQERRDSEGLYIAIFKSLTFLEIEVLFFGQLNFKSS